jgi:hypothetical protein
MAIVDSQVHSYEANIWDPLARVFDAWRPSQAA